METLILISSEPTIYAESYTGKLGIGENPFKSGSLNSVHPVVKRLELDPEDEFNFSFRYIRTKSEEFGEEEGFISISSQKEIKLVDLDIYEELKARERHLTDWNIKLYDAKTRDFEEIFLKAREEYKKSLEKLGYVEEDISDYDRDTEIYMVHPLYLAQWRKDYWKNLEEYPSWAIKEIGFFKSLEG
jgi:hypothetical protein